MSTGWDAMRSLSGRRSAIAGIKPDWRHKSENVRGADGSGLGVNGRPEYVRSCCEASLRRLGVDVIDLYYQHRVDPDTPIEQTVGAMGGPAGQGQGRSLGVLE